MNVKDLRTLRGQLLLTAGLFGGCVVLAGIIVSQRGRFESFVAEKYPASRDRLSNAARRAADAIVVGETPGDEFQELLPEERRALYELWMQGENPSATSARALVGADAAYYVRCAEQTIVCGNAAQRARALEFLVVGGASAAPEALSRLSRWAGRRNRADWAEQITEARSRLNE